MSWDEALDGFDERVAEHHHVDTYWFPHTDRMLTKTNDRLDVGVDEAEPLSRLAAWLDDEFLSNTLFGALNHVDQPVPGLDPAASTRSPSRLLSARDLQRRRPQGLRLAAHASSSGRWSTPSRARPASPRCARPRRARRLATQHHASRSRSG